MSASPPRIQQAQIDLTPTIESKSAPLHTDTQGVEVEEAADGGSSATTLAPAAERPAVDRGPPRHPSGGVRAEGSARPPSPSCSKNMLP